MFEESERNRQRAKKEAINKWANEKKRTETHKQTHTVYAVVLVSRSTQQRNIYTNIINKIYNTEKMSADINCTGDSKRIHTHTHSTQNKTITTNHHREKTPFFFIHSANK